MPKRFKHPAILLVALAATCFGPRGSLAACTSGEACTCRATASEHASKSGAWHVVDTDNFQVCCDESLVQAKNLARHAEALRIDVAERWLTEDPAPAWTPRCQIVLHSGRASFIAAVGRAGEQTLGSSLVDFASGRVVARRIDLLGGKRDYLTAALPHELTHVILQDRFQGRVPRWADEGAAILADSTPKRDAHLRELREALARRATFDLAALLTMSDYPPAGRWGTFYGQSASVAKFLIDRGGSRQFVLFLDRAAGDGYDKALRECYQIGNVAQLDRAWRQHLATHDSVALSD